MIVDLDKLERLAKAATPRPWDNVGAGTIRRKKSDKFIAQCTPMVICSTKALHQYLNNCDYIVAACNSLPDIIAENRALRERVRELEEKLICSKSDKYSVVLKYGLIKPVKETMNG